MTLPLGRKAREKHTGVIGNQMYEIPVNPLTPQLQARPRTAAPLYAVKLNEPSVGLS